MAARPLAGQAGKREAAVSAMAIKRVIEACEREGLPASMCEADPCTIVEFLVIERGLSPEEASASLGRIWGAIFADEIAVRMAYFTAVDEMVAILRDHAENLRAEERP